MPGDLYAMAGIVHETPARSPNAIVVGIVADDNRRIGMIKSAGYVPEQFIVAAAVVNNHAT
jgi:hypothetical protein